MGEREFDDWVRSQNGGMLSHQGDNLVIPKSIVMRLCAANADLAAENTTLKSLCQLSEGLPEQLADIARERDAALRRVAQMSDHPPVCPVSGQRYFMTIEHPTRGMVATYGGPLDSYTIPEANEEGELFRERYDHDRGCWYDTECLDVWLVAGSDLAEKDERNTQLTARLQEAERCLEDIMFITKCGAAYSIARDARNALREGGCPDCDRAARRANSDATTPGFHHVKCERHRGEPALREGAGGGDAPPFEARIEEIIQKRMAEFDARAEERGEEGGDRE